jgi:hypothetical protein
MPAPTQRSVSSFWSERRDLNSGPPVPQTGALTGLRYAPTDKVDYKPTAANLNYFAVMPFASMFWRRVGHTLGSRLAPPSAVRHRLAFALA